MGESFLSAFARGAPSPPKGAFTHTVKLVGKVDRWPILRSLTFERISAEKLAGVYDLDFGCPRCGSAPRIQRLPAGAVEITQHGRVRCFFARMLRVPHPS